MSTATAFLGEVKGGRPYLHNPQAWAKYLARLEGKEVEIIIRKRSKSKSVQAGRYYWGVVVEHTALWLTDTQGQEFTPEEAHELLKLKNNPREIKSGMSTVTIGGSTKGMSNEEFTAYVNRCIAWLYDIAGIIVPPSTDYYAVRNTDEV